MSARSQLLNNEKYTSYIELLSSNFVLGNCRTNGGKTPNLPCVFPFIFDGQTYNECALDSDGYWCSTKVESNSTHIKGNWGTCSHECPGFGTLI